MPATDVIPIDLTGREATLLANAADFAPIGCSIDAIDVDPTPDMEEFEGIAEKLAAFTDAGGTVAFTEREADVCVGMLSYQEDGCPLDSWCDVADADQEELNAIRARIAGARFP